jgi:hypothetical protein
MKPEPGIGATSDLSLRVSVATLVRVIFKHPLNDEWMLALERKATLHEEKVDVKSQPFGGAIRILDLNVIRDLIGDFHFDSEHSRTEQDFRLFIRLSSWSVLRGFCIQHLSCIDDAILETDPTRELIEEFAGALKVEIQPGQYELKPTGTVVEDNPVPTENYYARDSPTVRVYRIFEAQIIDSPLIYDMLKNNEKPSYRDLQELALTDKRNGGNGWANATLILPLKRVQDVYGALPPAERNIPIMVGKNRLDDTVSAGLEGIAVPKYHRL